MKFRLNPDRFNNFPVMIRAKEIEKHIEKSKRKFFWSNVDKTKNQALVEEIEGYYARNKEYKSDIPDFITYAQHWIEANRGCIPDKHLDVLEAFFGKVNGSLFIISKTSNWNTSRDWRNNE